MARIQRGDRVRVARLDPTETEVVREYTGCFLGLMGVVTNEPVWRDPDPKAGPLGKIVAKGECWVEFGRPCRKHGETGAVFTLAELEKVE